jgi:hypothetical protein
VTYLTNDTVEIPGYAKAFEPARSWSEVRREMHSDRRRGYLTAAVVAVIVAAVAMALLAFPRTAQRIINSAPQASAPAAAPAHKPAGCGNPTARDQIARDQNVPVDQMFDLIVRPSGVTLNDHKPAPQHDWIDNYSGKPADGAYRWVTTAYMSYPVLRYAYMHQGRCVRVPIMDRRSLPKTPNLGSRFVFRFTLPKGAVLSWAQLVGVTEAPLWHASGR